MEPRNVAIESYSYQNSFQEKAQEGHIPMPVCL